MAETYLLVEQGLYIKDARGVGTLINAGSTIVGVPGAYVVTATVPHGAVTTPVPFALPASWSPASVAGLMDSGGHQHCKLRACEQNSYNVLRQGFPEAAITVQPGKEAVVTRTP